MALEPINYGAAANDGTGDNLRESMRKSQANFVYLDQGKVDKVEGMGLSSNNFTNAERVKLANIGDGASNDRSKHTGTQTLASISNAGSAAACNVQASPADATAGAVLTVGAFGLGGIAVILGAIDLNTEPLKSGLYYVQGAANGPRANFYGWVRIEDLNTGVHTYQTVFDVVGNQWVRGRGTGTWSAWRDIRDRASFIGVQPISTITDLESRLDAALRVRLFSETSVQAFLTKIIELGPGYYRNSVSLPGIYPDSAGTLSLTADTFAFISTSYQTGETSVVSGNTSGLAAGTWQTQNLSGETGTNANGTYIKHANGVMECWGRVILPLAHPSSSATWTFPAVFTLVQSVVHCATGNAENSGSQVGVSNVGKNGVYRSALSNSSVVLSSYEYAEPLQQPVYLDVCAKGRWK